MTIGKLGVKHNLITAGVAQGYERESVVVSPRVMPFGHSMLSATSTCRSTPFIPAFSILARVPQSDQYMKLGTDKRRASDSQWNQGEDLFYQVIIFVNELPRNEKCGKVY